MLYVMIAVVVFFWAIVVWLAKRKPRPPLSYVFIDGSNVMYWDGQSPKIETVRDAVRLLVEKGYTPGVMFDANAGYHVSDGYRHDHEFAQMLGLPRDQVIVVGKGVQADPHLLQAARDLKAMIVTNDRFRDWAKDFPEVRTRGHLIHGGYHKGRLWLDFDGSRPRAQKQRRRNRR